jgi:hypothetical protein
VGSELWAFIKVISGVLIAVLIFTASAGDAGWWSLIALAGMSAQWVWGILPILLWGILLIAAVIGISRFLGKVEKALDKYLDEGKK